MSDLRVLIVGASIAGPMAAYWFAKAGADITIIERFPELRVNGQNVDIRTCGVTVMQRIPGMEASVRAKIWDVEGFAFVDANSKPFATMKATGDPNQQSLVSEFEISRGDLSQVLYDLTKDNKKIKYIFNEQVASMQQKGDDGPITVEFANSTPASTFDLVVAADGATSRTRAIGFGCGVRDHIKPMNAWTAYFSIDQDLLHGSKMAQSFSAVPGRMYGIGLDPSGTNRVAAIRVLPRDDSDATLPFREASKKGTDALKHFVAEQYRDVGWKTDEILKGMMKSNDFYASELVQVKVPSLYRGRFVLVGDAGYAAGPTGGGTSLAIGGAYLLAGEICRHKDDLAAGLKAYEERMQPIINDLSKIPPGMPGLLAPQTAWGLWLRNWVFTIVAWGTSFSKSFSWATSLFSSAFGGDKYALPEYEWVA